jgi:hypothetical protein
MTKGASFADLSINRLIAVHFPTVLSGFIVTYLIVYILGGACSYVIP